MSNVKGVGTVAMCRYTIRAAMFPICLALLISSEQSYAGGSATDVSGATRPTYEAVTAANDQQVKPSATAVKASDPDEEYDTPLSDYENGGYFADSKPNQSVTVAHKSKSEGQYDTPVSDYENGGYFTN